MTDNLEAIRALTDRVHDMKRGLILAKSNDYNDIWRAMTELLRLLDEAAREADAVYCLTINPLMAECDKLQQDLARYKSAHIALMGEIKYMREQLYGKERESLD